MSKGNCVGDQSIIEVPGRMTRDGDRGRNRPRGSPAVHLMVLFFLLFHGEQVEGLSEQGHGPELPWKDI